MSIKVTLRQKPISKGRQGLYLDIYPPIEHPKTGKLTRRQFLNVSIVDEFEYIMQTYTDKSGKEQIRYAPVLNKKGEPKKKNLSPFDKQSNKETLQRAEQIRQKLENQLNKPEIYTGYEKEQLKRKEQGEKNFVEYFKQLADKRKTSNHDNWVSAYNYLLTFTNGKVRFTDLDYKFCNEFKEYLLTTKSNKSEKTTLSQNSALSYFNKFKAALRQAYKDDYLKTDINKTVEPIKEAEIRRNFLTFEELNTLAKTPCQNSIMKNAALFSALTGLRFCDIKKMVWAEVEHMEGQGYFISFVQQKTEGVEFLPISDQAYSLLGNRKEPQDKVFEGLTYSVYSTKAYYQWLLAAGITKDITFHCFRHTFAALQLSNGTDMYTLQKMLGHRDIAITQKYAHIMDLAKREAAEKIKLDM
jgi:integrase